VEHRDVPDFTIPPDREPVSDAPDSLYDDEYAERYDALYLYPWAVKHERNRSSIMQCLGTLERDDPAWLDLCCGQAWHFSQFSDDIRKTGVDLSAAQLKRARRRNPDAEFIHGSVLDVSLPERSFDLVTCFWAAYCYLGNEQSIWSMLERAIGWTREGGALYFEILQPADVASFNDSGFASRTGFRVACTNEDCSRWTFEDTGGVHDMCSPKLEWFLSILKPDFENVGGQHDEAFMTHMIASGRCPD
jgi:predicted TPR repeat methyltransferase